MFNKADILTSRYQLKQRLGKTAKGHQTWLATDLETSETVTVKLLAFSPEMEWDELKLFEREAEVLRSLNHTRIPRYRDYFDIDKKQGNGIPWFALVQDYIPGYSLQELLDNNKKFSEQKVRKIAIDVLGILQYLHELNLPVLHRDIKPSNLILGEDDNIYLIDFGAVQAKAGVTGVTFTVVGTSGYSPLEQFWGKAVPSSDLYGLGATLIHLLTGISPSELPHKDYKIKFADKVKIKPDFLQWIETVTDIEVNNRFSDTSEALAILKSEQLIQKKTSLPLSLTEVFKPKNTSIILNKSKDKLTIYMPKKQLYRRNLRFFFKQIINYLGIISLISLAQSFIYMFFSIMSGITIGISRFFYLSLHILSRMSWLVCTCLSLWFLFNLLKTIFTQLLLVESSLSMDNTHCIVNYYYWKNLRPRNYKKFLIKDISNVVNERKNQDHRLKFEFKNSAQVIPLGLNLQGDEAVWLLKEIKDWLNLQSR